MTRQKPWDRYEAAILLEACIQIHEGGIDRKQAISVVSQALRKKALLSGEIIDEIFRNEAGITFQMYSMESAFRGYTVRKPATKLFIEIVTLRKNNKTEYDRLLLEAKRMIAGKRSTEEQFYSWLSKKVSPSQLSELYMMLAQIDEFCRNKLIIKHPLFEITDLCELAVVRDTVESNNIFRYQHKKQIKNMASAIRYYIEFIRIEKAKTAEKLSHPIIQKDDSAIQNIRIITSKKMDQLQESKKAYISWMRQNGLAESTLPAYVSSTNRCSEYAQAHGYLDRSLFYITEPSTINTLINNLMADSEFIAWNKRHYHRYKIALDKYLLFRKDSGFDMNKHISTDVSEPLESFNPEIIKQYKIVLREKFAKGFRLESNIDLRKFKKSFESIIGETIVNDENIIITIRACGIIHEGKLYLSETMLSEEKKDQLLSYIDELFSSGKEIIYYSAIFKALAEVFDGERIYTPEMLKSYLEYVASSKYYFEKQYLSINKNVKTEPIDEIRRFLIDKGEAIETEEIYSALSHLPKKKITAILRRYGEFARNSKGVYFHVDIISLSDDQLTKISNLIQDDINQWGYAIGSEIIQNVRLRYPEILEPYSHFSELGLRNVLAYRLSDRYSFNSNVISEQGKNITMMDVYAKFSRQHKRFTLAELEVFKEETDSGIIYFNAVYSNALRISENEFVSFDSAHFDIEQTDAAITRYLIGDYIPLAKIGEFGTFPYAGYPWNSFLLESYVLNYSKKYKLINNGFNAYTCVGAIVKKSALINNFQELLVHVLAESSCELYPEPALNYLYKQGYIGRRINRDIEIILTDANALRSKKGQ